MVPLSGSQAGSLRERRRRRRKRRVHRRRGWKGAGEVTRTSSCIKCNYRLRPRKKWWPRALKRFGKKITLCTPYVIRAQPVRAHTRERCIFLVSRARHHFSTGQRLWGWGRKKTERGDAGASNWHWDAQRRFPAFFCLDSDALRVTKYK